MTAVAHDEVYAIAAEIFAALVDGREGTLTEWPDGVPQAHHDVAAWVDVHGQWVGRASVETSSDTAHALARALLRLGPDAPVSDDDLADALGEVANVVGGNIKALLPQYGTLGLPRVAGELPADETTHAVQRVPLNWRGRSLVLTVWATDRGAQQAGAGGAVPADRWEDR